MRPASPEPEAPFPHRPTRKPTHLRLTSPHQQGHLLDQPTAASPKPNPPIWSARVGGRPCRAPGSRRSSVPWISGCWSAGR
jgi:hypothetical protein